MITRKSERLAESSNYENDTGKLKILEDRKALVNFGNISERKVIMKKISDNLSLTIFEGNHEMLTENTFNELIRE